MQGYNDYVNLTRGYLKSYAELERMRDYWQKDTQEKAQELNGVSVAIARYGDNPGGGTGELSPTERAAAKRLLQKKELAARHHDIQEIERLHKDISNCLMAMHEDDARILKAHYIDGQSWYDLADEEGYSYSAIRQKGKRALHSLAKYLFGLKAMPEARQIVLIA